MPAPIERGPFVFCPKSGKLVGCRSTSFLVKCLLPVVGLLALLWYLLRVGPKPSRADYPCQRVAAPLAWGFIGYLLSFGATLFAFRKARRYLRQTRYALAAGCAVIAAVAGLASLRNVTTNSLAAWTPTDVPNAPIGVARGIYPGRVVWVRDTLATRWNGSSGYWWDTNATDQTRVDAMLSQSLHTLTGANDEAGAWNALFHYYNRTHNKGDVGYTRGQGVLIKINQNTARSGHALNGNAGNQNSINGNPQLILAMLRQLVNQAGVPQTNIYVYDISRYIGDNIFVPCHAEFQQVHFVEVETGGTEGREAVPPESQWTQNAITYSDPNRACGKNLPPFVTASSYLINMAIMKNHGAQGATLIAKNHFGTIHGLNHDAISPTALGQSNPLVDMLANQYLGERTMLMMIDSLYGASGPDSSPSKWQMAPYNNAWPASLFVSQDGVAIESVGWDFVNAEWGCAAYTDNLMHEAALANNPPSGKPYGPVSLGAHEHWNNASAKQYSRNLGTGNGIELVPMFFPAPPGGLVISPGNNRIDLSWNDSPGIINYTVKRATTSGGPYTTLGSTTATNYADTAVVNGTAFFYVVSSLNALGESTNSAEVSAKPGLSVWAVNCGGGAAAQFAVDSNFTGGGTSVSAATIDTTGLTNPAPQTVYQSERHGNFSYTFGGFIPGIGCTVRLHLAETYWSNPGQRVFNVSINGAQALTNCDIVAATGAKNKALVREIAATASTIGQVVITFTTVTDNAKCSGIEIVIPTPATPTGLSAAPSNAQVALTWTAVPGATGYMVKRSASPGGAYVILTNGLTATSFTDTGLENWTPYYYVVAAVNAGGVSGDSTNVCASPRLSFAEWQVQYFGSTNAAAAAPGADPSHSGQNNWFKYTAGLDPTNPASRFTVQVAAWSNRPSLSFGPMTQGRTYTLQVNSNLTSGFWLSVTGLSGMVTNGSQATILDTNPFVSTRFYRVGISLP